MSAKNKITLDDLFLDDDAESLLGDTTSGTLFKETIGEDMRGVYGGKTIKVNFRDDTKKKKSRFKKFDHSGRKNTL